MDPRWTEWGAGASVCKWPNNLPVSIPSCSCVEASNCSAHIAFESLQEFVISVQDGQSVVFDICDARGAPDAPTASLKGKAARLYCGRRVQDYGVSWTFATRNLCHACRPDPREALEPLRSAL